MRKKMIAVLFLCVLFGACGGKVYRSYVYSFAGIENVKVNVELKNGYDLKNTLFDCYVTKDKKEILLIGLGDSSDLHDAQTLISAGKAEELENKNGKLVWKTEGKICSLSEVTGGISYLYTEGTISADTGEKDILDAMKYVSAETTLDDPSSYIEF